MASHLRFILGFAAPQHNGNTTVFDRAVLPIVPVATGTYPTAVASDSATLVVLVASTAAYTPFCAQPFTDRYVTSGGMPILNL